MSTSSTKTVPAPGETLLAFIVQNEKKAVPVMLAEIKAAPTLEEAYSLSCTYRANDCAGSAATACFDEVLDERLPLITDILILAGLYVKTYWHGMHGEKFIKRVKELFSEITTIDAAIEQRDLICEKFSVSQYTVKILYPVSNRICELLATDERRHSFEFLWFVWLRMPFIDYYQNIVSDLMPAALLLEKDLVKLYEHFNKARTNYHGFKNKPRRLVGNRIVGALDEQVPSMEDISRLSWYHEDISESCVETRGKIQLRIRQLIEPRLASLTTVRQVLKYRKEVTLQYKDKGTAGSQAKEAFNEKLEKLFPKFLKMFKTASRLRGWAEHEGCFWACADRFLELVPAYFKANPCLQTCVEWYDRYKHRDATDKGRCVFDPIMQRLIKRERRPEVLLGVKSNLCDDHLALAQHRFAVLVGRMTRPNQWFLSCIKTETFWGEKELFLRKAKEFVEMKKA